MVSFGLRKAVLPAIATMRVQPDGDRRTFGTPGDKTHVPMDALQQKAKGSREFWVPTQVALRSEAPVGGSDYLYHALIYGKDIAAPGDILDQQLADDLVAQTVAQTLDPRRARRLVASGL